MIPVIIIFILRERSKRRDNDDLSQFPNNQEQNRIQEQKQEEKDQGQKQEEQDQKQEPEDKANPQADTPTAQVYENPDGADPIPQPSPSHKTADDGNQKMTNSTQIDRKSDINENNSNGSSNTDL